LKLITYLFIQIQKTIKYARKTSPKEGWRRFGPE
jgi:hypothetical protein